MTLKDFERNFRKLNSRYENSISLKNPNINIDNENKIILNVGGTRFETNKTTLKKIPATRLSRLTEALANYDKILDEYFFDRHPGVFSQILNYYRTGKLHYPTNVCGPLFEAELEFWGLDSNQVEPCCWKTYTKHRDTEETLLNLDKLSLDEERSPDHELARIFKLEDDPDWQRGTLPWYKKLKPLIWQLFNEPHSSKTSKVITFISISFILMSIATFCLSTVNEFCSNNYFCRSYNLKVAMPKGDPNNNTIIHLSISRGIRTPTVLDYIEYVCITWFTIEFAIKYIVAPDKIEFFKSLLNWIDLIANLWFYIDFVYNSFLLDDNYEIHPAWDMIGTIRIMRLSRFFNHNAGLKVIIASLRASAGVLRLLVFFVVVATIIFSSLIFYAEKLTYSETGRNGMSSAITQTSGKGSENTMSSIFETFWFSIASLTTVGFGDYSPRTPLGMIFGAISTVAGVLIVDLPMPIIVANFANYYNHLQARSKFPKKLRRKVLPVEAPRSRRNATTSNQFLDTKSSAATLALATSRLANIAEIQLKCEVLPLLPLNADKPQTGAHVS